MNTAPFGLRTVLALVVLGAVLFVAILWMLGTGLGMGDTNNGGGHAGGRGLIGYAAMAGVLEQAGYRVDMARSDTGLTRPGLLVVTPPQGFDTAEITRIVNAHLRRGPVIVIIPKWTAGPPRSGQPGARRGWVQIYGNDNPGWPGFHDEVETLAAPLPPHGDHRARWVAPEAPPGLTVTLPRPDVVESGKAPGMLPLVVTADGRVLAAEVEARDPEPGKNPHAPPGPLGRLILVFEPDLLNNYGMARPENAALAEALVAEIMVDPILARQDTTDGDPHRRVTFDLTLNGLGHTPNLLTLAFTPPYLAATLLLIMLGVAAGWRAFCRFGPGAADTRDVGFGKRALIENAAGLIARTRRWRLLPDPYADAARGRIAGALGLPRQIDPAITEAAIDRAVAARGGTTPFSTAAAALRAARRPADILRAAQTLHAIERTLSR